VQQETIKGRDIVIVGQQPWDVSIGSNCKNIAIELAKNNRVLYVNSALERKNLMFNRNGPGISKRRNVIDKKEKGLISVANDLWTLYPNVIIESINWISITRIFDWVNKRNNVLFSESISEAISELGFKDIILFNDNDMFKSFYLRKLLKPVVSIYYSRDYMLGVDYWKKHGERVEPLIIKESDVCVANSTYLTEYCKKYNPNSYYIGQGCDLELFSTEFDNYCIDEIGTLEGPKIGYVGALDSIRLDIELIAFIAMNLPNYNIILVGPEDDLFHNSILHSLPNVIFTGLKSSDELPKYINSFDVCINPQLINEVTVGNYPRKIDEYLAMGKPVVATKTQAADIFKDIIYLAETKEEFLEQIKKGLNEDSSLRISERIKVAQSHSWENSIKELTKAIKNFI